MLGDVSSAEITESRDLKLPRLRLDRNPAEEFIQTLQESGIFFHQQRRVDGQMHGLALPGSVLNSPLDRPIRR